MILPMRNAGKQGGSNNVRNRRCSGFTLIEMLVTTILVAVAIVGVLGAIRAISVADLRARDADLLQRLAVLKLNEFGPVTDPQTADNKGDFTDQGYPDVQWNLEVLPSGTENLDELTITVTRGDASQKLTGLLFVRPTTGSTGA